MLHLTVSQLIWKEYLITFAYYFSVRLTFGCKNSPTLFDTLTEALCWILSNVYQLPFLVHLLNNFLVFTSSPLTSGLATPTSVFSDHRVLLSAEGTCRGPKILRINLDTNLFQTSLLTEKLDCICPLVSNSFLALSCSKHKFLSLFGHLKFALCIISQGRAFIFLPLSPPSVALNRYLCQW